MMAARWRLFTISLFLAMTFLAVAMGLRRLLEAVSRAVVAGVRL